MKNKIINIVVFCLILFSSLNGIAQSGPGTDADETGGAPTLEGTDAIASPINDYIIPMLLMGVLLGFSLLKKKVNPGELMKKNIIKIIVFYLAILSSINAIAQPSDDDASIIIGNLENPDDTTASISDYLIPMLLIGIFIGYRLLKQKKQLAK